jgi:glycosyltransferase involved in cell wall biosynthesis
MFLSIITRTYLRPNLLKLNQESLRNQTDGDWEQILLVDKVGIGVPEANKNLRTVDVSGDYVLILDDDNVVTDNNFIANLKILEESKPDLIIVQLQRDKERVFPTKIPPEMGSIDTANMVVSREMWYKHRSDFRDSYNGDFYFAESLYKDNIITVKYDGIPLKSLRISKGNPESAIPRTKGTTNMKIGDKVNILQGCGGSWGNFEQCDSPVTVTEKNIDIIESLVRGGIAELIGTDKSSVETIIIKGSGTKDENIDILSDSPKTGKRSRRVNTKSDV